MSAVIKVQKKESCIPLPSYQTEGAAGVDIRAFLSDDLNIPPLGRAKIHTGLFIEIPKGYEVQIRPRSGLADRYGITVLNSPGTIDSDYRGEVMVILINLGTGNFTVKNGDRIAQMVVTPAVQAEFAEAGIALSETVRGEGGFGSTGI